MDFYELIERVKDKIGDDPLILKEGTITEISKSALAGQFSRNFPRKIVFDIIGTNDYDYPLPDTTNKSWEKGFSIIENVEFPAGERTPIYIPDTDWLIYQADTIFYTGLTNTFEVGETITGTTSSATGTVNVVGSTFVEYTLVTGTFQASETVTGGTSSATATTSRIETEKLRLLTNNPNTTERMRITYTIAYNEDTVSQVTTYEAEALAVLVASYYCDTLARYYAQTSEGSVDVDVVDYQGKSEIWAERAKDMRSQYYRMTGKKEGTGAASITGDWDVNLSWGGDKLFHHGRRYR